jgi:hypothetical protein
MSEAGGITEVHGKAHTTISSGGIGGGTLKSANSKT